MTHSTSGQEGLGVRLLLTAFRMKPSIDNLEQAALALHCRPCACLRGRQCASLAQEAVKQRLTFLGYLEEFCMDHAAMFISRIARSVEELSTVTT